MNISFNGIKNASFFKENKPNASIEYFNTQLTDDKYGNDLSDYKNLVKKYNNEFQNPFYSNFVNIAFIKFHGTQTFAINGKVLTEEDKTLPIFSFIGKLTKKVSEMPEKEFLVDLNYLCNEYADKALLLDEKLSDKLKGKAPDCLEKVHEAEIIKKGAANLSTETTKCMANYFA